MKTLKSLFSIILITFALITVTSCGDESEDPTPNTPTMTNLEKVKASATGTWNFTSVMVTEISTNKSASTSTCEKSELAVNGLFTNTKWKDITPEPNFIFSGTNTVGYELPCLNGNPVDNVTWSITENSGGDFNFTLSNGRVFNIKPSDVTSTTVKASLVNGDGYNVLFTFTKS